MSSQKWIVFFTFLALFTFMEEATVFPACKEKILRQLKESITALENCKCSGKSTNFPVKVKQISMEMVSLCNFIAAIRKGILSYYAIGQNRLCETKQADKYQLLYPKLMLLQRLRIESATKVTVSSLA